MAVINRTGETPEDIAKRIPYAARTVAGWINDHEGSVRLGQAVADAVKESQK